MCSGLDLLLEAVITSVAADVYASTRLEQFACFAQKFIHGIDRTGEKSLPSSNDFSQLG